MKKLTLALVALLLALTCVFAACGKKDNNTTPAGNDGDTTNVPAETTVKRDDLTKIAEQFKADYVAKYLDLYTTETAATIEAEKSAALIKIQSAATAADATKIANDFFSFLEKQETIIDAAKALLTKIADVALADEGAINQLKAYDEKISAALATATSDAKKAVLATYDAATKKAVDEKVDQLDTLKDAKKAANQEGGINERIKDMKADYDIISANAAKVFTLNDANTYEDLEKEIAAFAAKYGFTVGSDAYKEIIDVATLAAAKAVVDKAYEENPVMKYMAAVIAQRDVLAKAAEEARYVKYVYVEKADLKPIDTTAFSVEVKAGSTFAQTYAEPGHTPVAATVAMLEDGSLKFLTGASYADEAAALAAGVKQAVKVELRVTATANLVAVNAEYKLDLSDDLQTAMEAYNALAAVSPTTKTKYGFDNTDNAARIAYNDIAQIAADYDASLAEAVKLYGSATTTLFTSAADYTDVDEKDETVAFYTLANYKQKSSAKDNLVNIAKEIEDTIATFHGTNAKGNDTYGASVYYKNVKMYGIGDYIANTKDDGTGTSYWFVLNSSDAPAIAYTAWEYHYELDGVKQTMKPFKAIKALSTDVTFNAKAQATLDWLTKYIGEGNYEDSYTLKSYKDSNGKAPLAWATAVLYMADRDLTEVADARVTKINDKAVAVEKDAAVPAKMLSVYTVANAAVEEQKKIDDARAEAVKDVQAKVLALREAGDANAIATARALYTSITNGEKVSKDLYKTTNYKTYCAYVFTAADDVIIKEASAGKTEVTKSVNAILTEAEAAMDITVRTLAYKDNTLQQLLAASAALQANKDAQDDNAEMVDFYDETVLTSVAKLVAIAKKGEDKKLIYTDAGAGKDFAGNLLLKTAKAYATNAGNLKVLFSDKADPAAGFDKIYATEADLFLVDDQGTPTTGDDVIYTNSAATPKAFEDFLDLVAPAYLDLDATFDNATLATYLSAIGNGNKADSDTLEAAVKGLTDTFGEKKEAYKGVAKLEAKAVYTLETTDTWDDDDNGATPVVPSKAIENLIAKIKAFASNNNADYLNLKMAVELFDGTVIECDFLTEAFREYMLYVNYKPIADILAETSKFTGSALAGTVWEDSVTLVINNLGAKLDAVTSINDATFDANNYKPDEEFYDLDTAVTKASTTIANVKEVGGF